MLQGYEHNTTSGVDKRISLESRNGEYVTDDIIIKSSMKLFHVIFIHSAVTSCLRLKYTDQEHLRNFTFFPTHPKTQIGNTCKTKVKKYISLSLYPTGRLFIERGIKREFFRK
jgi:hypothetical protein